MSQPTGPGGTPRLDERSWVLVVAGAVAVVLVSIVSLLPMPFGMVRPGPVENVLGEVGDKPMIEISGHQTYPTEGTLDLLTVRVAGGPGNQASSWDLVSAWASGEVDVRPAAELFDTSKTSEQIEEQDRRDMEDSQESATVAALEELAITVPATVTVTGVTSDSAAGDALRRGDVLQTVAGQPVVSPRTIRAVLDGVTAGSTIPVEVVRDGATVQVPVVTTKDPETGRALLGVYIDPAYQLPFEVKIRIEDVGGPSAGMMFALGIIDRLTPGAITGGQTIAGTGTMSSSGEVGPIGGIRQKMISARQAGAPWFLAPAGNCAEVRGNVPEGLRVIRVENLQEAKTAVEAIGTDDRTVLDALPGCD